MKAPLRYNIREIAKICGGRILQGDPGVTVESVTSDSRDTGTSSLFIPIIGERFDGHDFVPGLFETGRISASLTMKMDLADKVVRKEIPLVYCEDTLAALGKLGSHRRHETAARLVGITGTNGKTTTKEILYTILSSYMKTSKSEKNYNNEIGVPFALMSLENDDEAAVIEMGMNHSGELDRLSRMSSPDIALITNVGEGHLEFLGSVENVAYAKAEIMHGVPEGGLVVLNRESDFFGALKEIAGRQGLKTVTFGTGAESDRRPESFSLFEDRIEMEYRGVSFNVPLYGIHNVYNLLAALTVAEELGVSSEKASRALQKMPPVEGRSQIIKKEYTVINDTYNSNPSSSRYALESVSRIYGEYRKIAVLSDMKELGRYEREYHERTGGDAAKKGFDFLLACGEMAPAYVEGAVRAGMERDAALAFSSREELGEHLKNLVKAHDVILVKGSRSTRMEEIVNIL